MWKFLKKIGEFIMNLFTVNGELSIDTSNVYVNGTKADLSVVKISKSDYENLVIEENCLSNTLYVIEADYVDAYGQQMKNLADPSDDQDAVTLKYAKDNFTNVEVNIDEDKFVLKSELKELVKNTMIDLLNN